MASLANANLPSSDEEDDDYDPSMDPTGEKEPNQQGKPGASRKRRGAAALADGEAAEEEADEDGPADGKAAAAATAATAGYAADDDTLLTPAQTAKKARIGAMWEQLQQASTGSVNKLSKSTISLASLCSNTDPKKKRNTDRLWMRNLGITSSSNGKRSSLTAATPANGGSKAAPAAAAIPGGGTPAAAAVADQAGDPAAAATPAAEAAAPAAAGDAAGGSEEQQQKEAEKSAIRAAAAAALAAAKEGAQGGVVSSYNKVTLKEVRRFAGKDIEVEVQVDKDSKAAKRAAEKAVAAESGLDSFLQQIEQKKKVTVLDKSKMDWEGFKSTDTAVQEELEAHRRSDKQYLERQDFLKRAELREYEIERDKRLASDVRLRGRL